MNSHAQLSAAQQLASNAANAATLENVVAGTPGDEDDVPEIKEIEDDGPVDETGVDPKDIDLVMQQVSCSRAKAVRALRDSGGDLINASEFPVTPSYLSTLMFCQSWRLASDPGSVSLHYPLLHAFNASCFQLGNMA